MNFKRLPDHIHRKEGEVYLKTKKIKKPNKTKNIKGGHAGITKIIEEEEISDTSEEEALNKDIYFDLPIDNQNEVNKAKKTALNRNIDAIEWSG